MKFLINNSVYQFISKNNLINLNALEYGNIYSIKYKIDMHDYSDKDRLNGLFGQNLLIDGSSAMWSIRRMLEERLVLN